MALQLWETLKGSIVAYTGLSPAAFFTVLALGLAVYYVVSGLFGSSSDRHQRPRDFQDQMQPLPPPVQLGEISEEELRQYDGADPKKPLLMAIKGQIYDVSQSRYARRAPLVFGPRRMKSLRARRAVPVVLPAAAVGCRIGSSLCRDELCSTGSKLEWSDYLTCD